MRNADKIKRSSTDFHKFLYKIIENSLVNFFKRFEWCYFICCYRCHIQFQIIGFSLPGFHFLVFEKLLRIHTLQFIFSLNVMPRISSSVAHWLRHTKPIQSVHWRVSYYIIYIHTLPYDVYYISISMDFCMPYAYFFFHSRKCFLFCVNVSGCEFLLVRTTSSTDVIFFSFSSLLLLLFHSIRIN